MVWSLFATKQEVAEKLEDVGLNICAPYFYPTLAQFEPLRVVFPQLAVSQSTEPSDYYSGIRHDHKIIF
jgi:hypothetical protein